MAFDEADRVALTRQETILTQATYDEVAADFVRKTRDPERGRAWVDRFVARVPAGARVADLGSGPGRDSAQLRERGLDAFCLDRSVGMLRVGAVTYPAPRVQGDLLALPLRTACVDGVWANACLLHLSESELPRALAEIERVLRPAGCVHLTLKRGRGAAWESERYGRPRWFQYWSESDLDAALRAAGFRILEAETLETNSETWLVRQCAVSR